MIAKSSPISSSRAAGAVAHRIPALDRVFAADPAQLLSKDRAVFDPVPVGVDDRMVEPRLDLRCREMSAHRGLLVRKFMTRGYRRPRPSATGVERPDNRSAPPAVRMTAFSSSSATR